MHRVFHGLSGVRVAALLANHPRWEPYAVMPLVRFCAGGDQRWSSLPGQVNKGFVPRDGRSRIIGHLPGVVDVLGFSFCRPAEARWARGTFHKARIAHPPYRPSACSQSSCWRRSRRRTFRKGLWLGLPCGFSERHYITAATSKRNFSMSILPRSPSAECFASIAFISHYVCNVLFAGKRRVPHRV